MFIILFPQDLPESIYLIQISGFRAALLLDEAWECALQSEMDAAAWESCQIVLNSQSCNNKKSLQCLTYFKYC